MWLHENTCQEKIGAMPTHSLQLQLIDYVFKDPLGFIRVIQITSLVYHHVVYLTYNLVPPSPQIYLYLIQITSLVYHHVVKSDLQLSSPKSPNKPDEQTNKKNMPSGMSLENKLEKLCWYRYWKLAGHRPKAARRDVLVCSV